MSDEEISDEEFEAELWGLQKAAREMYPAALRVPAEVSSDATTSAGCGAGERSRRGRRGGAPRSHGARPAGRAGMIDDLDDYIA